METLLLPSASAILYRPAAPARPRLRPATERPNLLWWLFLAGISLMAFAGPVCAIG